MNEMNKKIEEILYKLQSKYDVEQKIIEVLERLAKLPKEEFQKRMSAIIRGGKL